MGVRQIIRAGELLQLAKWARQVEACLARGGKSGDLQARLLARDALRWVQARAPQAPRTIRCGCGHVFPEACGRYGCPNCCGDQGGRAVQK